MPVERIPIVIIGAGFGGIAMAIALGRAGERRYDIRQPAPDCGRARRHNKSRRAPQHDESRSPARPKAIAMAMPPKPAPMMTMGIRSTGTMSGVFQIVGAHVHDQGAAWAGRRGMKATEPVFRL